MRKIKWGVLGTAGIADINTIPGMKEAENCELYAIAGRNLKKAEAFRDKFGFEKAYGSLEELLADPAVEAVYIPLPNNLHVEWAKKAADAGKHILCEKPLTPTAKETEELFDYCGKKGVILMEAFAYLHSPVVDEVKKALQELGKIRYMDASFMTSFYDHSNIRMRRDCTGGSLYDLGCYCTSLFTWMLEKMPEKTTAFAEFSDDNIDLYTTALLDYGDGVRAAMRCGMVLDKEPFVRSETWEFRGEKGYIRTDFEFNACGELNYRINTTGKEEIRKVQVPQNYGLEVAQLGRCITDGEKPHVSKEFSIKNAAVMDGIFDQTGYYRR